MVFRFHWRVICLILLICICVSMIGGQKMLPSETIGYDTPLTVLLIDPGHGGADGGAVGINGIIESEINLSIGLKLRSLCRLYGVPCIMTRESNEIAYPDEADTVAKKKLFDQKERLRLIRDNPHGILFSIHQNFYPSSNPSGVEVLYGHNESSREVGELLQRNLTAVLCPHSRRIAAEISDDIYLLRECQCTAALIECGFLSNPAEAALLSSESYQAKIAAVLLASYLQYTNYT